MTQELGILLLDHHRTISFVSTTYNRAAAVFARIVVENLTGYDHALGGSFDHTPLSISYFTERKSVMLVGKITEELYEQVRQRVQFEINRRVFDAHAC
jgi:hypothetical protein